MSIVETLLSQWTSQSTWEVIAVILALAYVWLAARQHILCWPCALVSTAIYTWIFWENTLPMQAVLNAYYLLMACYGWWHWHRRTEEDALTVSILSLKTHLLALFGLSLMSLALAYGFSGVFVTDHLYLDAFVTIFSLFATFLMTRKVLENWLYWIVIDGAAAWLYWQTELYLTSLLFLGYLGFAVYGFTQWRRTQPGALADAT